MTLPKSRKTWQDSALTRPCKSCGGRYMPSLDRRDHKPSCPLVAKYPSLKIREEKP